MKKESPHYTNADLFWEAYGVLTSTFNPFQVLYLLISGVEYNLAIASNDRIRITAALHKLHPELRLFERNYLGRKRLHHRWWGGLTKGSKS